MQQRRHTRKRNRLLQLSIDGNCTGWSCEECPISCKKEMTIYVSGSGSPLDTLRTARRHKAMKEYKRAYGLETLKNDLLEHGI